jgi:GT2 family glycosyltransferase
MHRKVGLQTLEIRHGGQTLVLLDFTTEVVKGHCVLLGFGSLQRTIDKLVNCRVHSTLLLYSPNKVALQDLQIAYTFTKHWHKWRRLRVSVKPEGRSLMRTYLASQKPLLSVCIADQQPTATNESGNNVSCPKSPLLSVLTVNYNQTFMTDICLMAAGSAVRAYNHELLCVDNGSTPAQRALYSIFSKQIEIHRLDRNTGFAAANNTAARLARGEYLLFLNNDAFLTKGSVTELLAALGSNPRFVSATPVLLSCSGKILEAGAELSSDARSIRRYRGQRQSVLRRKPRFETVQFVSAACLLIRRDDFLEMGGFSLRYSPAYYEDTDLCMRILTQGKINCVATRSLCYHLENATSADNLSKTNLANLCERNRQRFLTSWSDKLSRYCAP